MRSLTLRMGVVSIVMLLATIVEGRAFLDFSLNKRSLEDEINGFLDRVKQTKANLCLYGCVRFQVRSDLVPSENNGTLQGGYSSKKGKGADFMVRLRETRLVVRDVESYTAKSLN